MLRATKTTVIAGAAVVALVGIGGGVAFATSGSSTPTTTTLAAATTSTSPTPSSTTPAKHKHRRLLGRAEHAVVTVKTKTGSEVIDLQRGSVTAVSPTSLTVKSVDGFTTTYTVSSTSKVTKEKQQSAIADVATGDRVLVVATHSGNTDTVRRIADHGPAPAGH